MAPYFKRRNEIFIGQKKRKKRNLLQIASLLLNVVLIFYIFVTRGGDETPPPVSPPLSEKPAAHKEIAPAPEIDAPESPVELSGSLERVRLEDGEAIMFAVDVRDNLSSSLARYEGLSLLDGPDMGDFLSAHLARLLSMSIFGYQ